ncbi:unnamed protein product [Tenebrio molitor]|nr:unnamed protein product [Tenebrio molitor]
MIFCFFFINKTASEIFHLKNIDLNFIFELIIDLDLLMAIILLIESVIQFHQHLINVSSSCKYRRQRQIKKSLTNYININKSTYFRMLNQTYYIVNIKYEENRT